MAVHQGVGRNDGLGSVPRSLLDVIISIEDIHGPHDCNDPAQPEQEHLLPFLGLGVLGDRAAGIERVVLVHFRGIEILRFALEEIHDPYLPDGTTT